MLAHTADMEADVCVGIITASCTFPRIYVSLVAAGASTSVKIKETRKTNWFIV